MSVDTDPHDPNRAIVSVGDEDWPLPVPIVKQDVPYHPMARTTPIYVAVVDDDENLCQSLGRLLRATGIQPITYASAEAFLADTRRPQFDCLVLDIQLGGMSGIELGEELVAQGDHTPFIYITAYDEPDMRTKAEAVGCAGYFRKTDSGTDLLEAIRKATV